MKATVNKSTFAQAVRHVGRVVSNRSTLPILSNTHIATSPGRLSLMTTDLDQTLVTSLPAETDDVHATSVPVKRLSSLIKEMKCDQIVLNNGGNKLELSGNGAANMSLLTLPGDEFPPVQGMDRFDPLFHLTQGQLKRLLKEMVPSISSDETRYVLNGVLFERKDNTLFIVATNGRCMTLNGVRRDGPNVQFILPSAAVKHLLATLVDDDDSYVIIGANDKLRTELVEFPQTWIEPTRGIVSVFPPHHIGAAHFLYASKGIEYRLITKLIEGTYPNYMQVIPNEHKLSVPFNREALLAALKSVNTVTTDKSNSVKLHFFANVCTITAKSPELGEAKQELQCACLTGDKPLTIALNVDSYVIPTLEAIDAPHVVCHFVDELSPMSMTVPGMEDYKFVVMPMRLS